MTPFFRRVVLLAAGAAFAIAVSGFGWELIRFGTSLEATADRLERSVRSRLAYQTNRVESLARSVAVETNLVRSATSAADGLPALFARLADLRRPVGLAGTSATVYVPDTASAFRVLAWSDGPAEDLSADRLSGPPSVFVTPGASGLRLVAVQPIVSDGQRLGVAAAELVLSERLSQATVDFGACSGELTTAYGPVVATAPCGGAGVGPESTNSFLLRDATGQVLLEVQYNPEQLLDRRATHRRRLMAATGVPLVALLLLLTGPALARRVPGGATSAWIGWTGLVAGALLLGGLALTGLSALLGITAATPVLAGLTGLALAGLTAGGWWWRPLRRHPLGSAPVWFVLEHVAAGLLVASTPWLLSGVLRGRITGASIEVWQFPLFPFHAGAFFYLVGVLLTQIALCWTSACTLGVMADRWRLGPARMGPVLFAALLWILPTVVLVALLSDGFGPAGPWLGVAVALSAFGLLSRWLRHVYRHTTQALRLVLLFAALAAPPLVTYPLTAAAADEAARTLIETDFAPAILEQPQVVLDTLTRAQREIDALPQLDLIIATAPQGDGRSAYAVWSGTSLATARLTSEVELFGADLRLVSRFALNIPEYPYEEVPSWGGSSCSWEVFGEVARTGAQERVMLHAERAVCDQTGTVRGAVVVHAVSDYRSLSFVASGSPYADALRSADRPANGVRLAGLEVAVYGWNDAPLFTSGEVAWPVTTDLSLRLYRSREPFWTTRDAGPGRYAVYFVNDRRGFYAIGYPVPDFMEHATRLAEITSVVAVLLVVLLTGAAVYGPLVRQRATPLAALFDEIRTSFYRKLFLFFVLSAVGPVILLTLAFGAYTSARIRADVESEAASAATITRRLFEEFTAFEQHPDQAQAPVSDELMVLISQMTEQDANLYEGARLVASSQRDLFDSGLLSTRTPAGVYREIALNRLPAYVGEDQIGAFTYLVAAAPVPARGRHAVISVPLGTRQREIEHEIDELNRRMLVGAVVVVLFAAGLGASVAGRVSDPVARLTRAARQIAAGRLNVRIVADTADELRRLVDDFNTMAETLVTQRAELARTNQLKAWAQMSRQVAHEIKNPLTPIHLAAEHLQRVHEDHGRPMGAVVEQCVGTILRQVRLLRQIASDFSNFAAEPTPRFEVVDVADLIDEVVGPYEPGTAGRVEIVRDVAPDLPAVRIDRTLVARALTNLIENAIQAMPEGGRITLVARAAASAVTVGVTDTGVGMDLEAAGRAFEPYFSTKTGGSGLGLPNAKRYVELSGGTVTLASAPGRGTTITLNLPADHPEEHASGQAPTR